VNRRWDFGTYTTSVSRNTKEVDMNTRTSQSVADLFNESGIVPVLVVPPKDPQDDDDENEEDEEDRDEQEDEPGVIREPDE
jgi:hypothetical protein